MLLGIVILALIFTFGSTQGEELNYDDERYIRGNELIRDLDGEKLGEIFTSYFDGHYHPLTLLSLAVDRQIGDNPITTHHTVNWLLHLANAILVYLFLLALFRKRWLAFGVAALFVVHPMAVESYAWMTERKNVLYSFFFLLSAMAYTRYLKKRSWALLAVCFVLFALSILSKAQAMMLVPVLFLIDWAGGRSLRQSRIYLEKIPFFLVALVFVFATSAAQAQQWGNLGSGDYSQVQKIFLASWAFLLYLVKGLVPLSLSAYYPYPADFGQGLEWYHYASPMAVLAFLGLCYYAFRKSKILFFGLVFFFVNLFLMLKFLDVPYGSYLMANRYNYLPLLGLMLVLVQLIFLAGGKYGLSRTTAFSVILIISIGYGALARQRIDVWHDNIHLWSDIIDHYPAYAHAYNMRGLGYLEKGNNREAIEDFETMLKLDPDLEDAYGNLAILSQKMGQPDKAMSYAERAKEHFPDNPRVFALAANLGLQQKKYPAALQDVDKAIELSPGDTGLLVTRARILALKGQNEEARAILERLAESSEARRLLASLNNMEEQKKAQNSPSGKAARLIGQATALAKQGRYQDAMPLYNQALALDSTNFVAYLNRGSTLARLGEIEEALADFQKAKSLNPGEAKVYYLLGAAYKDLDQKEKACANLWEANQRGFAVGEDLRRYCTGQ